MSFKFTKIQGTGNDFVCCLKSELAAALDVEAAVRKLCDRHFGVGSDGVMVVDEKNTDGVFSVTMYNPDGSQSGMCGNGVRCIVRFMFLEKLLSPTTTAVSLDFAGRKLVAHSADQGKTVRVNLGEIKFDPQSIPVNSEYPLRSAPFSLVHGLVAEGSSYDYRISAASVGNPHCVIVVKDLASVELERVGPIIERHSIFPKKANVEFVEIVNPTLVKVRVWERGAGVTLACGSGACATVAALAAQKLCEPSAEVHVPGGKLHIAWDPQTSVVTLTGPAQEEFTGVINEI